jgi:hypothetical protein
MTLQVARWCERHMVQTWSLLQMLTRYSRIWQREMKEGKRLSAVQVLFLMSGTLVMTFTVNILVCSSPCMRATCQDVLYVTIASGTRD